MQQEAGVRVVAINAGNANCAAGQAGLDAARATSAAAAKLFGCPEAEVFPSSTGIIGVPLPAEKLVAAMPAMAASMGAEFDHFEDFSQAILTTDTIEKTAFAHLDVSGPDGTKREVRIAAACKGSGMIHPQLIPHATMLVYILTDGAVEPAVLDGYLRQAIEVSFNRISVDGDTSTNDTVLLLASGASGAEVAADNPEFAGALTSVCTSLARQIVADGEGITHVVELHIGGAASDADALKIAKAIAHSPLVKDGPGQARTPTGAGSLRPSVIQARKSIPTASTSRSATCPCAATAAALRSLMRPRPTLTSPNPSFPLPSICIRGKGPASSGPPT